MKRVITILLLLIMAGQATGIFYSRLPGFQLVHELEEKHDHGSKEDKKEDTAFISHSLSFQQKLIRKIDFILTTVIIFASPVIDHLTPPPDTAFDY